MTRKRPRTVSARQNLQFRTLGLRDYEAARCLLLNGLYLPGATLASTAVEKYLKCVLGSYNVKARFHLDQLPRVRQLFRREKIDLFDELDPTFMTLLSKAYRFRYYDTLKDEVFGFLYWQFLGELDYTVHLIEGRLTIRTSPEPFHDRYREAMEKGDQGDPMICKDNYIALGLSKKDFMERRGPAIIVRVMENGSELTVRAKGSLAVESYDGGIARATDLQVKGLDF